MSLIGISGKMLKTIMANKCIRYENQSVTLKLTFLNNTYLKSLIFGNRIRNFGTIFLIDHSQHWESFS